MKELEIASLRFYICPSNYYENNQCSRNIGGGDKEFYVDTLTMTNLILVDIECNNCDHGLIQSYATETFVDSLSATRINKLLKGDHNWVLNSIR